MTRVTGKSTALTGSANTARMRTGNAALRKSGKGTARKAGTGTGNNTRPTLTREDMDNSVRIRHAGSFDYTFLFLTLFFFIFGLVMITSISAYNATKYYDDAFLFVKNQALYGAIGIFAMVIMGIYIPRINYKLILKKTRIPFLKKKVPILISAGYIICLILQWSVLVVGHSNNGSSRWFNIGSVRFQPSELTKLYIIILAAYLAQKNPKKLSNILVMSVNLLVTLPLIIPVAKENLSTAIIMIAIVIGIFWVVSRKQLPVFGIGILAAIGGVIMIKSTSYRSSRIDKWLNVETSADAYQILQGLYALVSGGFFGKGLGNSVQKLGYIPEVHTDMIFSCIVEELGIFGAIMLLALYAVLLSRILKISMHAGNLFGSLICVGVFIQLAVQVIFNIAVVTNTIPATGVTLPLVSYGGSSLIFTMVGLGLVMNVSRQIPYEEEQ